MSTLYLNRYRVLNDTAGAAIVLDRHSAGATYRAENIETGQAVALRIIDVDPAAQEEAEHDAAAAQQITHLNIPAVYDCAVENHRLICASEFVDGTTAEEWVTAHGPMPIGAGLRIALQVVNALGAATFHGLVRRSINPHDILLVPGQTAEGEWPLIKVTNFTDLTPADAASAAEETARRFASPEQQLGSAVDFRSQIYSLGATLGFLLTAAVPAGAAAVHGSGLPKAAAQLLAQMLATEPSERPQDPLAFQEQISQCLIQVERREAIGRRLGIPVTPAQAVAATERSPSVLLKPLAFAAAMLLLGVLGAVLLANGYTPARLFASKGDAPIGVPVGVPEKTAVASAATATPAPVAEPEPVPVASASAIAAATPAVPEPEPPQLVSNDPAPADDEPPLPEPQPSAAIASNAGSETSVPAPADEPPAPVETTADSTPASQPPQPSRAVVQAAPEPEPQPPVVASNEQTTTARREPAPENEPAAKRPAQVKTEEPRVAKAAASKAPTRIANREVRRAEPISEKDFPKLPRGSQRARYVGTAADGSLMFETSSEERVYAAPPGYERRDRSRRRRLRTPIPDDQLPVMRAEPLTDDELARDE